MNENPKNLLFLIILNYAWPDSLFNEIRRQPMGSVPFFKKKIKRRRSRPFIRVRSNHFKTKKSKKLNQNKSQDPSFRFGLIYNEKKRKSRTVCGFDFQYFKKKSKDNQEPFVGSVPNPLKIKIKINQKRESRTFRGFGPQSLKNGSRILLGFDPILRKSKKNLATFLGFNSICQKLKNNY